VPGPYDLSRAGLAALLEGEPPYRLGQVWDGLHRALAPGEMTVLPLALRRRLAGDPVLAAALEPVEEWEGDGGDTVKWLCRLDGGPSAGGPSVETVLMRYPAAGATPGRRGRATVCVSTQAGCAMACGFCATGQAGFQRHLTGGEIVEQVVLAQRRLATVGGRLTNVVFMGMGEPLANYDRVWAAVHRLHDHMGFSARHLTISTVGLVPGIHRMAAEPLPVNLAVSLHAANDDLRSQLVPVNRRYPLAALAAACHAYRAASGRRLSLEWALIDGVNDRRSDVAELAAFALPLAAHVNLIPLNPTPGFSTRGTPPAGVRAFCDRLVARGVNATVRRNRGTGIDAACGQLAGATRPVPVAPPPRAAASAADRPALSD